MSGEHPLSDGVLHSHWRDISTRDWRWRNFTPRELACNKTDEFYWHERTLDALQQLRNIIGRLVVNSAHRNWLHNVAIGGAPRSAHLWLAIDVSIIGHNLAVLYWAAKKVGFRSFGFYDRFIHLDLRPGRMWFGSITAKEQWAPIIAMKAEHIAL